MSAATLTLYMWLAITIPGFVLALYLFGDAYLNWRQQVERGSNGARHRVAENAVLIAGALMSALLFFVVFGLLVRFPASEEYREGVQISFRLYAMVTVIFILVALLRSVKLIRELVTILDNVAADEGLDMPSLHPPAKATINSQPIRRPEVQELKDAVAMPIVTAPVTVVVDDEQAEQAEQALPHIPVVVAPAVVITPLKGSVADRAADKGLTKP